MALSEPILQEQVVVFGKEEDLRGRAKWPQDFFDSKLGLNSGYDPTAMGGVAFAEACISGKIKLQEAYTTEANLRRLAAGRIRFYLNASSTNISPYPMIMKGPVVNSSQGYLGFTKQGESFQFLPKFSEKFNEVIRRMKESKEVAKIANDFGK